MHVASFKTNSDSDGIDTVTYLVYPLKTPTCIDHHCGSCTPPSLLTVMHVPVIPSTLASEDSTSDLEEPMILPDRPLSISRLNQTSLTPLPLASVPLPFLSSLALLWPWLDNLDLVSLMLSCRYVQLEIRAQVRHISFTPHRHTLTDVQVQTLLCTIPHLTSVRFTGCLNLTDASLRYLGPDIRALNAKGCWQIANPGLAQLASNCPRLTSLNLGYLSRITDEGLVSSVSSFSQLRQLNLRSCAQVSDRGITALSSCPNLESVNLWYTNQGHLTDAGIEGGLRHLKNLRHLNLSNCSELTNASFTSVIARLTKLQTLECANVVELTDEGMLSLADLGQLEVLDVAGCYRISDSGMTVVKHFPHLTSLNCWYLNALTDHTLQFSLVSLTGLKMLNLSTSLVHVLNIHIM